MSVKIKIKNKLEGTKKTNIGGLNWKEKSLTKAKQYISKEWGLSWKK
jgi:hypothetical protein